MSANHMGIVTGVVIGALLVLIVRLVQIRKGDAAKEYDERQLVIRGTGYKIGYWTLLALLAIYVCVFPEDGNYKVEPIAAIFGLILISGLAMAGYDIMKDAYFTLKYKKNQYTVSMIALCLSQFALFTTSLDQGFVVDGVIPGRVILPLELMIFFGAFAVLLIIKSHIDKREDAE